MYYDTIVVDNTQQQSFLVFASIVGYTTVINNIAKEINKQNNIYMEGCGYCRSESRSYTVEKKKESSSDFMHAVIYHKDAIKNENNDEVLYSYIFCKNDNEKMSRVFDKLYKHTAIPVLQEWMPYIISQLTSRNLLKSLTVRYDNTDKNPKPFDCYMLRLPKSVLRQIITEGLSSMTININGINESSVTMSNITGLDSYLTNFGDILARRIQESFIPKFIPGESEYDSKVDDYDDACYDAGIEIFDAQKAVIQASVNNLNKNDITFVIGEMGSGKTLIGAGIVYAHTKNNGTSNIILCPSHLTNKWKREIERLVPNGKAYIIRTLDKLLELDSKIKNKNKTEHMFIIISKESAKFGYEMKPAAKWSKSKRTFVCPECGQPLVKQVFVGTGRRREIVNVPFTMRDMTRPMANNKVCMNKIRKWNKVSHRYEDMNCNAKLWAPVIKEDSDDNDWIKLGSEGWVMKSHVDYIFNSLVNQQNMTRKDVSFFTRLSEAKARLDSNQDIGIERAPRKYPLAKYIREYYNTYIDYLIGDELHMWFAV